MDKFEPFKELFVGGMSKEALLQRLRSADIQINTYADILFRHRSFTPEDEIKKQKLIKIKLVDLGLENRCQFNDIVDASANLGLGLCPIHLGAFLRLEYLDQSEGSYLTIASPRPENDESYPTGFYIRNFENSLWLRGYKASGDTDWPLDNEFVFLKF